MPKDFGFSVLVFIAVCGFFVFGIWFSVFVEVTCGFSVLLCDVVLGFSYFVLLAVFGFARIFMRFWVIFSSVLRFLIYPNVPFEKEARSFFCPRILYVASYHFWIPIVLVLSFHPFPKEKANLCTAGRKVRLLLLYTAI